MKFWCWASKFCSKLW